MKKNQRLFRIVSLESFLQLVLYKNERFVNPLSWEDTYEGCALRFIHDQNRIVSFIDSLFSEYEHQRNCEDIVLYNFAKAEIVRDFSYGQCWSLTEDSDAMWRIYSYSNHSLQIESTLESLENLINSEIDDDLKYIRRIDTVEYDVDSSDKESAYIRFYQKGMDFSESFFHKRKAFEHENEVRVLYRPNYAQYRFSRMLNKYRHKLDAIRKSGHEITKEKLAEAINEVHVETNSEYSSLEKSIFLKVINLEDYIHNIKVHPFAEQWYVDLVAKVCEKHSINFGGKSTLYSDA